MPGVVGSLSLGGVATEVLDLAPPLMRSLAVAP
jgi:hypothetical protein